MVFLLCAVLLVVTKIDDNSCASLKRGEILFLCIKFSSIINSKLPKAETYKESEMTIKKGEVEVTFFKRMREDKIFWAFKEEDKEKVAELFDLTIKAPIRKLTEGEIPVSIPSFGEIFVNGRHKILSIIHSELPKANTSKENKITIK